MGRGIQWCNKFSITQGKKSKMCEESVNFHLFHVAQGCKINLWQARFNFGIDSSCKVCFTNTLENLIHPLWGCPLLYKLYRSSLFMSFIYRFHSKLQNSGKCKRFTIEQCLFNSIFFKKINEFQNIFATFEGLPYGSYGLNIMNMC